MIKYFIEQINVSDSEYKIIELNTSVSHIKAGDMIFSYESSKASYEVIAEQECNFYISPKIQVGELYKVGTLVAVSSNDEIANSDLIAIFNLESSDKESRRKEDNIIVTKKAQALIDEYGIDLSLINSKSIITEELLLEYLNSEQDTKFQNLSFYHCKENLNYFTNNRRRLAVIGAGKAALQLFDSVIIGNSHEITLFYEENKKYSDELLMGLPIKVISDLNQIVNDFNQKVFDEIIISFSGDIKKRKEIFDYLVSQKIPFTNVIHPSVIIGSNSKIGVGNLIFANSRLGPFSVLGNNNVISSYCSIEHHNYVGSHNTFGPCVCFSGTCKTGNQNKFGTGIYIEPNVSIGNSSIISSGISLTRNVPDNTLVKNLNKVEFKSL